MKRLSILVLVALFATLLPAQQKGASVALYPLIEEFAEPFPETAQAYTTTKVQSLLTKNGVASMDFLGQFFITVQAVPVDKNIVPGPPAQIASRLELTLYIADYYNKTVLASTQQTLVGIGTTEAKAYMDALKKINVTSKTMQDFIVKGKEKIVDYYDTQAPAMFAKAETLAKMKNYEEALFILVCIPSECKHFDKANELAMSIYQQYYDQQCQANLAAARMAWAAEQNAKGAAAAGEYLALIYSDAACYGDAMELYKEIKAKVLDDWKFEMKKYQDAVDLESQRIESWRAVGVAYGSHQQPVTTNVNWLVH